MKTPFDNRHGINDGLVEVDNHRERHFSHSNTRSEVKAIQGTEMYEDGNLKKDILGLSGTETYEVTLHVPVVATPQARYIVEELLQGWVSEFVKKNLDYQDESANLADELGSAGQWGDLYRKIRKLKRPMWTLRGQGPKMEFEQVDEILRDMIGHAFLAIFYHYKESPDDRH